MSEEAERKWTWQEIDRAVLERGEMVYNDKTLGPGSWAGSKPFLEANPGCPLPLLRHRLLNLEAKRLIEYVPGEPEDVFRFQITEKGRDELERRRLDWLRYDDLAARVESALTANGVGEETRKGLMAKLRDFAGSPEGWSALLTALGSILGGVISRAD